MRNDWPKLKDVNKAKLNSLMTWKVSRPTVHTTEVVKYVGYKRVFYVNYVKIKLSDIRKNWWHKNFRKDL
ncbi:hypothetical protein Hdeb2414_s0126g00805211 [Helianthus debilis subsp. tardiflorus]